MNSPFVRRLPQVLGLTLVWVALWGVFSPKIILGGLIVAVAVTVMFPMPLLDRLPVRPWPLLRLVGFLLVDLVRSGFSVGWETVRHGPRARAGIIAVPMLTRSGRVATMVAGTLSLAPGSFVLQIDRRRGVWYVYALGVTSEADVERVREQVLTLQRRVIAAFGHPDEVAGSRADVPAHPLSERTEEPS
ncbi:multisubunit sodium/proton antiporter MrpE subunit [Pseudonocardia sediminis]|uniref:Multisubunit sodium/proton antiporter MrpE subunit n=1 Tax=Pseudonocardia sediminis TaxID=1397368 RepID=A0A4Q7UWU6_PSEST|nr:Na+/H+ antiporter subunit E [Pseudonocardia sediminis]RZT84653.1 multisubunit sodium/proton antiporter MrpE subunit [Pseudonocardia sediminis]